MSVRARTNYNVKSITPMSQWQHLFIYLFYVRHGVCKCVVSTFPRRNLSISCSLTWTMNFEECWYALEYNAALISINTSLDQRYVMNFRFKDDVMSMASNGWCKKGVHVWMNYWSSWICSQQDRRAESDIYDCLTYFYIYIGWNDVTTSMVTIRLPFCGYNLA